MSKWGKEFPSKEELRSKKRSILLTSAALEFRTKGYHATTMDGIAAAIGVSKAALYRYIKSKDEVLYECFKNSEKIALRALVEARAHSVRADEQLRCFLVTFISSYLDSDLASGAMIEIDALTPEQRADVVAGRDRIDNELLSIIKTGMNEGSIALQDPKLVVLAIMGSVNWIPSWFRKDGLLSADELAEHFANILVDGVRAR